MTRIAQLHINNFKFFGQETPIELDGNHLLLYGENGSGKSTIYWSLYTLFEAPFKNTDDELIKYFEMGESKNQSLVNIHAKEISAGNFDSFISVTTDDSPADTFRLAVDDVVIRQNEEAKLVNYASDFIQYKLLQNMHNFLHKDPIDLFDFFVKNTLQHVQFAGATISRGGEKMNLITAIDIWKEILEGPDPEIEAAAEFEKLVNDFNEGMKKLIAFVNTNALKFLERLGYANFKFYLKYDDIIVHTADGKFEKPFFKVELIISEYEGMKDVVHRAQSFLNEAKLNAIGISVRLAILFQKISHEGLKFVVLDDLLISLDMRNREKVLDLFLSDDFANNFQLLILTHDQHFFQMAKNKIKRAGQEDWIYYEMYEMNENGIAKPLIRTSLSYLEQAEIFLKQKNFDAAGNFLRRATEEFCKAFVPVHLQVDKNYDKRDTSGLLDSCIKYATDNNLDHTLFKDLHDHREFIFNALSHDNYDVPRFRNEIEKCFITFHKLQAIKFKTIIEKDSDFELHFEMHDGKNLYRAEFTIYGELRLIQEPEKHSIVTKVIMLQRVFKDGNRSYWPFKSCNLTPLKKTKADRILSGDCSNDSLKRFYDNWFNSSNKTTNPDFWDGITITRTGQSLRTLKAF